MIKAHKKNKIYICGNGGSASLAEHFSCDHQKIIYEKTKQKFNFVSLTSNISLITAIANDISYEEIFSKQIEISSNPNDLLICISASGNSGNIIKALKIAKKLNLKTFGLYGQGGKAEKITNNSFIVKSKDVQIIEDIHTFYMHICCKALINEFV